MKKIILLIMLLALANPAYAKKPCASLLCMAGMFQGSGMSNECNKPVKDYFSIIKFNHHGGISTNKTSKARGDYLKKCPSGNDWGKKINDKYGGLI